MSPVPNPFDPRLRNDLSANETTLLHFMSDCMHGHDMSLVDRYVAEDYIQHTPGIGQGRDGLRHYLEQVAWKRPGRLTWRPIHLFACGDFVILHKLLPATVIADFMRFNAQGQMAEHWDVVQPMPEPDYDPMRLSTENLSRFAALFKIG
jgi:predicted SnoaL-like aldol condensation-catalyzing enzyme